MDKDYKILGLNKSATEEEVRKAYKKKALMYHPDKNKSSEAIEIFNKISESYQKIINPQDSIHDNRGEQIFNPEDLFRMFFQESQLFEDELFLSSPTFIFTRGNNEFINNRNKFHQEIPNNFHQEIPNNFHQEIPNNFQFPNKSKINIKPKINKIPENSFVSTQSSIMIIDGKQTETITKNTNGKLTERKIVTDLRTNKILEDSSNTMKLK